VSKCAHRQTANHPLDSYGHVREFGLPGRPGIIIAINGVAMTSDEAAQESKNESDI
jgi:hypothetical protein